MATAILTAKMAAREHRGRVLSSFFCHTVDGRNQRVSTIQSSESLFNSQRLAVVHALANLLPIEEGARESLQMRLAGIDEMLSALKPRKHRYPILSLEPLTWRDKSGYPKLVVMALDQPGHVEIKGDGGTDAKWHYLPLCSDQKRYSEVIKHVICRCYKDVGRKLIAGASAARLSHKFIRMELDNLLIPPKTQEKISKARKFFGDQLFLIAEAGKWVEGQVSLPKPDPLIVGYEDGLLFLIDVFDLKRIEDIARSEFVIPQPSLL